VAEEWFGGNTLVLMVAVMAAWLAELFGGSPSSCFRFASGGGSWNWWAEKRRNEPARLRPMGLGPR
jgi:hypothetical protein